MEGQIVLITGVTGHVGFRAMFYALDAGLSIRAVVRSQAKAETVRCNPVLKAKSSDYKITFVVIPNFAVPGAFDDAAEGAQYIIHCASPMPFGSPTTDDGYSELVRPAVEGTLGILRSATKSSTIKRVIITSTCLAVAPLAAIMSDTGETYTPETRQPDPETDFPPGTPTFAAYAASKVATLNQAEKWMKESKPKFDLIHMMPTYVVGRNDLCESTTQLVVGPNGLPLNILCGPFEGQHAMSATPLVVNHIDECARIHVEGLRSDVQGNQSFLICYDTSGQKWDDAKAIVQKHFPDEVAAGIFHNSGTLETIPFRLDTSKTKEVFGFKHTYEDAVVSIVQQYLELHQKQEMANGGLKN